MARRFGTIFAVLFLLFAASARSVQAATRAPHETRQEQLAHLQNLKKTLDDARTQLSAIRERLGSAQTGEASTAEEIKRLRSTESGLSSQIAEATDALNEALVNFITANAPLEGEPVPSDVQAALDIKAEEDVAIAWEYIHENGEYDRAIAILEQVLAYDPGYSGASDALDRARELRYVTAERFAQVHEGMTTGEVWKTLGPVPQRNVRTLEDSGQVAWYYPTGPDGSAAAVYFCGETGSRRVCRTDFEALPAAP